MSSSHTENVRQFVIWGQKGVILLDGLAGRGRVCPSFTVQAMIYLDASIRYPVTMGTGNALNFS